MGGGPYRQLNRRRRGAGMKKLNLKPMRPGGYYPSQLGLDDEYRDLRRAAVSFLDELGKVGKESLARWIERMPPAEREIALKLFSLQYSCIFQGGAVAAILEFFKPEDERYEFFEQMENASVTMTNFITFLRALDQDA
jgi:hypothetical protein